MPERYLTILGAASIQSYIFGSNRLKENLGASHLVANSLSFWATDANTWRKIYVGGGNALVAFDLETDAIDAVKRWSKQVLENAPGLRVSAARIAYADGNLFKAYQNAQKMIRIVENRELQGAPLGALPFARQCTSTGGAAAEFDSVDRSWVSLESFCKQQAAPHATQDLKKRYAANLHGTFRDFPIKMEDLGLQTGDQHIAVVHADGTGIGKLFSELRDATTDDEVRSSLTEASEDVNDIAKKAMSDVLALLVRNADDLKRRPGIKLSGSFFPIRPIVDGGDDATFVCHGKLGLALAVSYLQSFANHASAKGRELTACGGVAIVPSKYPFSRAYELAEALCLNAKRQARKDPGCWLDFEIVREGGGGELDQSRKRNNEGITRARPYRLTGPGTQAWSGFESCIASVKRLPRSKAKLLRDAIRSRREIATITALKSRGFDFRDCGIDAENKLKADSPLFDVLDAIDMYIPLKGGQV